MTNYFAPSPYDWPPSKVVAPNSLKGTDLFPAVTLTATHRQVKKFGDVVAQEDELGTCLVAHFEVFGTLIIFYQSALDDIDYWTVFVDMVSCVDKEQFPTKLGHAVVRHLTNGAIKADWENDDADTEYRSRRRRLSPGRDMVHKLRIKSMTVGGALSKPARVKSTFEAANDWTMVKVATGKTGRFTTAKKPALTRNFAAKKSAAPAKKAVAVKRAAPTKKAAPAKS
jgi:hypothetical protein